MQSIGKWKCVIFGMFLQSYFFRTLAAQFKYALVWGTSTKYSPQRVGVSHIMADEDVIQIVKK